MLVCFKYELLMNRVNKEKYFSKIEKDKIIF